MGTPDPIKAGSVILFDGLCNLCSSSVQFIIKRDSSAHFRFASLQSSFGQHYLEVFKLPAGQLHSIILIQNGIVFQKSSAALEILKRLDGPWPVLYVFKIVPSIIRDWLYSIIAKNRYAWFGKKDACMIPTPELKSRFIQ